MGKKGALLGLGARILASLLVLLLPTSGGSQNMEVTTYMPSPSGNFEKLRVRNNAMLAIAGGNVAIGHEGPVAKLDVNGNTLLRNTLNVSGVTYLGGNLDLTGLAYFRNSLGIGTASPATPLDVNGRSYLRDVVVVGNHAARTGVTLDAGIGTIAARRLVISKNLSGVSWNIDMDPGQSHDMLRIGSSASPGGREQLLIASDTGRVWFKLPGGGATVEGVGGSIHMVNGTRIDISETGKIHSSSDAIVIQGDTVRARKIQAGTIEAVKFHRLNSDHQLAFFLNVNSDECGWAHPYLGCPPGYIRAGTWHVGPPSGLCDAAVRGTGHYNGNISKGWMALCVSD